MPVVGSALAKLIVGFLYVVVASKLLPCRVGNATPLLTIKSPSIGEIELLLVIVVLPPIQRIERPAALLILTLSIVVLSADTTIPSAPPLILISLIVKSLIPLFDAKVRFDNDVDNDFALPPLIATPYILEFAVASKI